MAKFDMAATRDQIRVIDVDTHLTEPHDLWSSRAPADYVDRLPKVADVDGRPHWILDGEPLGFATASGVVRPDGSKALGTDFMGWTIDEVHPGAYDMDARVEVMDQVGIHAQIIYPNLAGFGSQKFGQIEDVELKRLCVSVYNDAMAEIQENSGERLFPMGLIPWWDIEGSLAEAERIVDLGLRGIVMCSDPQLRGLPDLGEEDWRPLWEFCCDQELPVNFHIGASESSMGWFGTSPWPSQGDDEKLAIGSAMMYLTNARVLANLIFSGVLERYPTLKIVSVESGVGWIPFVLESLDYQMEQLRTDVQAQFSLSPSEYFRRQMYGCYWFEDLSPDKLINQVGPDNVLFETDFPHPTCLYPFGLEQATDALADVGDDVARKVLQDNAAELYKIAV